MLCDIAMWSFTQNHWINKSEPPDYQLDHQLKKPDIGLIKVHGHFTLNLKFKKTHNGTFSDLLCLPGVQSIYKLRGGGSH